MRSSSDLSADTRAQEGRLTAFLESQGLMSDF